MQSNNMSCVCSFQIYIVLTEFGFRGQQIFVLSYKICCNEPINSILILKFIATSTWHVTTKIM